MDMIGKVRRLHSRKNKSEREISRITGLSRNTVAKWLHGEVDGPPKYRRGAQRNKLTAFHEALQQALKADARRAVDAVQNGISSPAGCTRRASDSSHCSSRS